MNESTPSTAPDSPPVPSSSLAGRLVNVFAVPGEVFEELKAQPPRTSNWLVPLLLACLAGAIFCVVVFSQPNILYTLRQTQEQQLQKRLDAGKMTKEQKDAAVAVMEKLFSPTLMKITGTAGAAFSNLLLLFGAALVVWLVGAKAFRAQFSYMQAVQVTGLSSMIHVLGAIITMFLVVIIGSLHANLGPVLLVREFDPANKLHLALASLNVITLWYLGVLAVGLAKLSGVSWAKAALWLYGLWAALSVALILPGWGR
jgi:Yip1 domain